MKKLVWRLLLKKGWYQITWNGGLFDFPDRAFWNGKDFTKKYSATHEKHAIADVQDMSIFVKRLSK